MEGTSRCKPAERTGRGCKIEEGVTHKSEEGVACKIDGGVACKINGGVAWRVWKWVCRSEHVGEQAGVSMQG